MCHLNGAPSNIFHFGKLSDYRCFRLSLTTLPSAQGLTKANHFSGPFRWIQLPLTGSMCVWTISKDVFKTCFTKSRDTACRWDCVQWSYQWYGISELITPTYLPSRRTFRADETMFSFLCWLCFKLLLPHKNRNHILMTWHQECCLSAQSKCVCVCPVLNHLRPKKW